jgi:hypothetical protein
MTVNDLIRLLSDYDGDIEVDSSVSLEYDEESNKIYL